MKTTTNEKGFPVFTPEKGGDNFKDGAFLGKTMRAERSAHALSGYWFTFSDSEMAEHKNANGGFKWHCECMVRAARDCGGSVELFRNANGQMAARLLSKKEVQKRTEAAGAEMTSAPTVQCLPVNVPTAKQNLELATYKLNMALEHCLSRNNQVAASYIGDALFLIQTVSVKI